MIVSAAKIPPIRPEKTCKFHDDIVAVMIFDFTNLRTWEAAENKGMKRLFWDHGTWEHTETQKQLQEMSVNSIFMVTNCRRASPSFSPIFELTLELIRTNKSLKEIAIDFAPE